MCPSHGWHKETDDQMLPFTSAQKIMKREMKSSHSPRFTLLTNISMSLMEPYWLVGPSVFWYILHQTSNQSKAPEAKSSCTCSTRNHKLILWPILWIAAPPMYVLARYQWIFSWNTIPTGKNRVGDKAFFLLLFSTVQRNWSALLLLRLHRIKVQIKSAYKNKS